MSRGLSRLHPTCVWMFLSLLLSIPASPVLAASISYDQCASCGSTGGGALQIFITDANPGTMTAIGFVNPSFVWSPATSGGPIISLDASVNKDLTITQTTPFVASVASGFRPLIEQDGNFYILNPAIAGPTLSTTTPVTSLTSGYSTISQTGLTSSEFQLYDFSTGSFITGSPNFAGDPMMLGLATILSLSPTSPLSNATFETDFDTLSLTINDPTTFTDLTFSDLGRFQVVEFPVPEPASVLLFGAGLVGLWARTRDLKISPNKRA